MDLYNLTVSEYDFSVQIYEAIGKSAVVLMFLSENVIESHKNIYDLEFKPSKNSRKKIYPIWLNNKSYTPNDVEKKYKGIKDEHELSELKKMLSDINDLESSIEF